MVSRFREELRRDGQVEGALVRTMQTAGRTVAFSGVTVAVSLASLLLFPQNFLRSMGFGGMAAVLVAMVGALTVLPALLAVLGRRVDSLRIPMPFRRRRAAADAAADAAVDADHGAWSRIAHSVMRRPVVYVGVTVVLLLALGAPFLRIAFGGVDARVLPEGTPSRTVSESLQRDFAGASTSPIEVVVTGGDRAALGSYVESLRAVPGVVGADVTGQAGETSRISLAYSGEATADTTQDLVAAVRDVPVPNGVDVLVGGETASLVDLLASLGDTLPWMALFVIAVTGVLLFLAFGSVVLPIKAVVMNVLSLAATFGAVVWIFQDGNLSGLLGFTATGTIEATQPILILALAFGLSMDYEVFLLSRIREQWDRTGDNTQAVATGLQRSGKIITSAALLLVVVIGAFATSGITFIKMIGLGMVVAIVIDATVVRALLVPATMRLLGRANWYAPKPLLRVYDRIGFKETDEIELPGPRTAAATPEPARG
jgi:RND superfamily putative drug exporter